MKNSIAIKIVAASAYLVCHSNVFAHEGHGLNGTHWHATDTWGFVLVVAVAVWLITGRPGGRK